MIRQSAALLHRALRVDVRLVRSHLFRISLLAFLCFLLYDLRSSFVVGAPGLEFFRLINLCNVWFVTFAGVTFFATAITEEKEEQTLGLLKMAGMSSLALLTGKWAPRVVGGLLLLTVQVPFTLLAITLGGVLWDQVIAAYCTLLAHLVLVGCVGLLCSVVAKQSSAACVTTMALLGGLFLGPQLVRGFVLSPRLGGWLPAGVRNTLESVSTECIHTSAWTRLGEIQATNFNEPPLGLQVTSNLLTAAAFFGLAWLLFDVCTRNESAATLTVNWRPRLLFWQRSSRRAWDAALLWKDYYSSGGAHVLFLKLVGYGILLMVCVLLTGVRRWSGLLQQLGEMTMSLALVLLLIEAAVIAARCFRSEIRQRTWASLCMLPRSVSEIAYRKVVSHGIGLLPLLAYFWFGALLAPGAIVDFLDAVFGEAEAFLALTYALSQLAWAVHLIALLSISIDWAAWPVSIFFGAVVVFIWNVMFLMCLESTRVGPSSEVLLLVICLFGCGQVAFTHWLIGDRLRTLAGR